MNEFAIDMSSSKSESVQNLHNGETRVYVAINGKVAGILCLSDVMKSSSHAAIRELQDMGIDVIIMSGDNKATTSLIATKTGITNYIAEVRPEEKAKHIQILQQQGKHVAMVGDGINDAPALAYADIGIAMGTGTDVAIETADMTIMNGDLSSLKTAIMLSRVTIRTIRQNLFWAFIYNVIGIPIAAFGLLNPMYAAAAMAFSSVSVVSNSLRIRRKKTSIGKFAFSRSFVTFAIYCKSWLMF